MTNKMKEALEELLHYYKEGREPNDHNNDCPLCEVVGIKNNVRNCEECQWTKEGFIRNYNRTPCINWRNKYFGVTRAFLTVQKFPQNYPEFALKRIEMIEQWLINDK
jgi:hypothetical protein